MKKVFSLLDTILRVLAPISSLLLFVVAGLELHIGLYQQATATILICIFIALVELNTYLKRHDWTPWEHVMFVEDWRAGTPCYELLRSECLITGNTRYKKVLVGSSVHRLAIAMNDWENTKQLERNELNN